MRNAKNETKTHDLRIEKIIAKPPAEVFRALREGRLFQNCSADTESMKIDFRVGGKYEIRFLHYGKTNGGEFLEIVPDRKIVFTWCQDSSVDPRPDTVVSIELEERGGKTHLVLTHAGFKDRELMEAHQGGWSGGLDDLADGMVHGRLRLMRRMEMPLEALYAACANPGSFFGRMGDVKNGKVDFRVNGRYAVPTEKGEVKGEFLEIVPGARIVFSWESAPCGERLAHETRVTLTFEKDDDDAGVSWLGLVHEGLDTESQLKSHHAGWDGLLSRLMK